jgi:hypothetical protein
MLTLQPLRLAVVLGLQHQTQYMGLLWARAVVLTTSVSILTEMLTFIDAFVVIVRPSRLLPPVTDASKASRQFLRLISNIVSRVCVILGL